MTQALNKLVTFDEFVNFLQSQPENICYELYDGEIIQVPLPTGDHEEIIAFLVKILTLECHRRNLNYGIPKTVLVKPENKKAGYFPDVPLLNLPNLINESQWKKESIVSNSDSKDMVAKTLIFPQYRPKVEPVRVN